MSTITDLTGYTWNANNTLDIESGKTNIGSQIPIHFNITNDSGNLINYDMMGFGTGNTLFYGDENGDFIEVYKDGLWKYNFNKNVLFTGMYNNFNKYPKFIQWLQNNGMLFNEAISYYTISFNRNGATSGDSPSNQTLEEGTVFNLVNYNPNNLAKTNSTFLGWNTTADATEVINEIIVTSDVTLYAIFKETKSDVFELKLYQSTAEPNRVNKTSYLTLVNTIQGALRNYTSITDLSITIEYESVPNFNYIYIPIFNRYYFVTDISSVREHLWEISASCDVLMTYKDSLLNCSAFIDRNENSYDQLIIDNKLPIKQGQTVDVHFITNTLFDINDGYYVLQGLNLSVEEDTETQSTVAEVKEVEVNGN